MNPALVSLAPALPLWWRMARALVVAGFAALCFAAGWAAEGWRKDAAIDRLHRAHAEVRARDAELAAEDLRAAVQRGDELAARAAAAEAARDLALEETRDALRKATTGRPCLPGAAVRLLNHPAGLRPPALPAPAGEPAGADGGTASDTDVALWAAFARRSYDTCRGRIAALADFFAQDTP